MTDVCGIRRSGIVAPKSFVGGMTTERFVAYIRDDVCPTLKEEDIIILDNLSAHKSPCVRCLIEQCKASLLYLPPYSPDLNPIENSFAKEKSILRKERFVMSISYLLFWNNCRNTSRQRTARDTSNIADMGNMN
jgi:transposase